ncbi:hypothetical protein LTR78_001533 [Recurvomyces mirabilis]|uniref:Uncharacterized protein n=1 Tax=Recurvomyces mirabilis TaxID=574656 RepID=A0AAE1C5S0_9PEZI|nr:hypothetical protein LTR78_001533 [Recurvomyces mirabilis]KAK5161511.1 hypothetical protein LTS14_001307 [Recurvomyces mirabilis]
MGIHVRDGMREMGNVFRGKKNKRQSSMTGQAQPHREHEQKSVNDEQRNGSWKNGAPGNVDDDEQQQDWRRSNIGVGEFGGERGPGQRSPRIIAPNPPQLDNGGHGQVAVRSDAGVVLYDGDYNSEENEVFGLVQQEEETAEQRSEAVRQQHNHEISRLKVKHEAALRDLRDELRQNYRSDLAREKDQVGDIWKKKYHESCEGLRRGHEAETKRLEDEHQRAFQEVKKSYQDWHDNSTIRIQRDHTSQLAQSEREHERECQELRSELSEQHRTLQQKYDTELNHLKGRHQTVCQGLDNEVENQRTAVKTLREQHQIKIVELDEQHKEQCSNVGRTYQQQLDDAKLRHEQAEHRQVAAHKDEQQATADERAKALFDLEQKHKLTLEKFRQEQGALSHNLKQAKLQLQKQMYDAQREVEEVETTHRAELKALKDKMQAVHQTTLEQHKTAIKALDAKHAQANHYAQNQIEELNAALLVRDDEVYRAKIFVIKDLPQRPDDKIRESFAQTEKLIDDLSDRHAWDPAREIWPDHVLQRLCGSDEMRMLRKSIIRDLIWCLLFQFVFAHPFRMFGEEGDKLQALWSDASGQDVAVKDYINERPTPSVKTERWRYMTLEECYLILTQPVPAFMIQRERIKTAYQLNIAALAKAIETTLAKAIRPTAEMTETANNLARRASKLWLDLGRHRCRIVVRQAGRGPKAIEDRISSMLSGSFKLTITPIIGRYGNNKGSDLENFTSITGSANNTYEIPKSQVIA